MIPAARTRTLVTPARRPPFRAVTPSANSARWLFAFIAYQMVTQVLLVFTDLGQFRTIFRIGAFGLSLAYLVLVPGLERRHPARPFAVAVLAIVGLSVFHPDTDGFVAGIAQATMYLAILAPVFWATRLQLPPDALKTTLALFWAFHAVGAALGVLQVYFPGHFQPNVASVLVGREDYLDSLMFESASGAVVYRPMGLTDTPGGAAVNGHYAMLLGIGVLLTARKTWFKGICVATMVLGMASVYLSQVRVSLVMLVISLVAVAGFFAMRGELKRFVGFTSVLGMIGVLGLTLALALGGDAVSRRLNTLVNDDPAAVYYRNRGHFLEGTIEELLPQYPLGAGLGRWGMIHDYFGAGRVSEIWVEIQWTGWLLDGGVLLVLAYLLALLTTMFVAYRTALAKSAIDPDLWIWATIMFGYNLGTLALTFSYAVFISQAGMEFWLLNAAFFAALPIANRPSRWVVPRAPHGKLRRV